MRPTPKMIALRMKTRLSGDGGALTSPSLLPGNTKTAPLTGAGRWYRPVMFALAVVLGLGAVVIWVLRFGAFSEHGGIGLDHTILTEFGRRWLETGSLYLPSQLTGTFAAQPLGLSPEMLPAMYPPTAALLFAPLTVLPWFVWWVVPIGLVAYAFARWRPAPWTWPLFALMACHPNSSAIVIVGSSSMWVTAAVAGGLLWGWPILLVALKPTFAPFLLIGIRRRSWWLGAAVLGAVSVLMLPEWLRYVTVLRNSTGAGLLFSINDLPLVLVPVVAWLGRLRRTERDDQRSGHELDVDRP